MIETWKHQIVRESLDKGYSVPRMVKEFKLSTTAILNEIDSDLELKMKFLKISN